MIKPSKTLVTHGQILRQLVINSMPLSISFSHKMEIRHRFCSEEHKTYLITTRPSHAPVNQDTLTQYTPPPPFCTCRATLLYPLDGSNFLKAVETQAQGKNKKSERQEIKLGEKEVRDRVKHPHTPPDIHKVGGCTARAGQRWRINIRSTIKMIQRALWWFLERLTGKLLNLLCRQDVPSVGFSLSGVTGAARQLLRGDRGPSRTCVLSHRSLHSSQPQFKNRALLF